MKFVIAKEHRDFFNQHQLIEFENLISPEQIKTLLSDASLLFKPLFKSKSQRDFWISSEQIFCAGRDLWRSSLAFKALSHQHRLGEIAGDLSHQKVVRLGYDQLLPAVRSTFQEGCYQQLLNLKIPLEEWSCLQGNIGGWMLCLEGEASSSRNVFSCKPGNGIFFSSKTIIDFTTILQGPPQLFYCVVYTQSSAVYIYQERDPLATSLKQQGYSYGDKLIDKKNPVIYRL